MQQVLFITRHSGARDWARAHTDLSRNAEFIAHLPSQRIATLAPSDIVVGTLPIQLVAAINSRGARYLHLVIDLPPEAREKRSLSAEEMARFGARLEPYFALSMAKQPEPDGRQAGAEPSPSRRSYWRSKVLQGASLLLAFLALLSGGVATNILAPVLLELMAPAGNAQATNAWVIAAGILLALVPLVAAIVLFRLRNRVFTHYVGARRDRVKAPCRVLITGLSNDTVDPPSQQLQGDLLLEAIQSDPRLDLALFGKTKRQMEVLFKQGGAELPAWHKANWLTNFTAIAAHAPTLETLVVVPSRDVETDSVPGSIHRLDRFSRIAQILWSRSNGSRPLRIVAVDACDYDNYAEVLDGIGAAIERGGARRPQDVCIDITSGTKPISVAAAVSTMNRNCTFIYVTNARHFWIFDARIGVGEALG